MFVLPRSGGIRILRLTLLLISTCVGISPADDLVRLQYNNPGLKVDLGVGLWAWPMPMDFDRDGDNDLVVVCPDKPYNGTYFFENTDGDVLFPTFKPGVRISNGLQNVQVSYIDGEPRVLSPGKRHHDFFKSGLAKSQKIRVPQKIGFEGKIRANQWKQLDFDGDGVLDLIVGIGDWKGYGWDDAYNERGEWTNDRLHGYVFVLRNKGSNEKPNYEPKKQLTCGGHDGTNEPVDVFGWPSPNFVDFDADGDLDLLCGEFLDGFTYFKNTGSRKSPVYASGIRLKRSEGRGELKMDLQMIVPVAFDWDKDGDFDLVVGDEDGRVALVENTGQFADGLPQFEDPKYFQQEARHIKFGALATPCGFDWDGDGDDDIICGNTAGYIAFIQNLGGSPVKWAAPSLLAADEQTIRIQAGPNGSIQGPCEAKWGYTTQTVADWDHDGLPDIMVNSIWGRIEWFRNVGTRTEPKLVAAQPIEIQWTDRPPKPEWNWWNPKGKQLVSQWRTTPVIVDFNRDGLNDLVMLDHEGYLALFKRSKSEGKLSLSPGERIFVDENGKPIRLNPGRAGRSGRRKLSVVDWDSDGRLDVLANAENAEFWRNVRDADGQVVLKNQGLVAERNVAGHTSSPTVIDLNGDGRLELLVGAEDGRLYHAKPKRNP